MMVTPDLSLGSASAGPSVISALADEAWALFGQLAGSASFS